MISTLPNIATAARQIRSGEITPTELVDYCLGRIQQWESEVHAWVLIDADGAHRQAEKQTKLIREGQSLGPLQGIPIGIKDIVDIAGWPTRAGSPLRADHLAMRDAPLVTRLREAGAIILGKTVTTEFAGFDPSPTRNPWNLAHTPGGSSSGSAAAVALEMCMAAIASQTGGSIIRPASYCGVCGLKPSHGKVPLEGVVPISSHLDHVGSMARNVSDLAIVYDVIHSTMARPEEGRSVARGWGVESLETAFTPAPVILAEEFFLEQASEAVRRATLAAYALLCDAPDDSSRLKLPRSFSGVHAQHWRIMAVDAAVYHRDSFAQSPAAFGPNVAKLIRLGLDSSAVDYVAALRHQQQFRAEMDELFAPGFVAAMPATATTAPASLDTTGDPKLNSPWSYAGLPAVTIPCGLADDGMPCGLQLVGPRNSELQLLRTAAWCEARLGFAARPQLLMEA